MSAFGQATRRVAIVLVFAALASPALAADPAASVVQRLDNAIIGAMKAPKSVGAKGRYRQLEPVVSATFNLPAMTQDVAGPAWDRFSASDRAKATAAFTRLTVASYAANFQGFAGESFVVDGVQNRGDDKIVQARLVRPNAAPVPILYQVHQSARGWGIVDVYFAGVSQVAAQRSELAPSVAQGPAAMTAYLNAKADKLLK